MAAMKLCCPICGGTFEARPGEGPFPFCSERCRLVDLGNWLDERYRVPVGRGGTAFADEADGTDGDPPEA